MADALPGSGAVAVSGSMLLGRSSGLPPLVLHVKPVAVPQPDDGARHIAALILIIEPRSQHRIDPDLLAKTLWPRRRASHFFGNSHQDPSIW